MHTPVKSYADILKPLVDGISDIPNKYTNVVKGPTYLNPNTKDHSDESSFEGEEEIEVSLYLKNCKESVIREIC